MVLKYKAWEDGEHKLVASIGEVNFYDEFFDGDGIENHVNVANSFNADSKIDVLYNGVLKEENEDWERDPVSNTVTNLDENGDPIPFPTDARIRVRIFDQAYFVDQLFDGGNTTYNIAEPFTDSTRIDVLINGKLTEENEDWARNTSNQIIVTDGLEVDARMRVRVYR